MCRVVFEVEGEGRTETMWAVEVGAKKFRIDNVPFFVYGVSRGDVVVAEECGAFHRFNQVAVRGGHSTYRIWMAKHAAGDRLRELFQPLEELGCEYEKATENLIAIDVPPTVDVFEVYRRLEEGEQSGHWEFEEGHCGHPVTRPSA